MAAGTVHRTVPAGTGKQVKPVRPASRGKSRQRPVPGIGVSPARPARTTIQVNSLTKLSLDQIKEMESLDTYDEVINFLIRERRKHLLSTAGSTPGKGTFERDEEEDPYRVPR
jgi:hypothetical protein